MRKIILSLALMLVCWATPAWAQGCGSTNPSCIVPMPPPEDDSNRAAPTAWVNNSITERTRFNPADYGAVCNGTTDDTVAINLTLDALRATGTTATRGGQFTMAGLYKCKVTGPLNFTGFAYQSNIVVDFAGAQILGSVVARGPVGTLGTITGGSAYTPNTYTSVPLTGGTGTGCTATVVVGGGGAVTSVTVKRTSGGSTGPCGTGYATGDTLSAAAASIGGTGSGFSVPVATLSGGAIIDATGSRFMRWDNVAVYGDCSSVGANAPNIGVQIGRYTLGAAEADVHSFKDLSVNGCFKFAHFYNVSSETNLFDHPVMIADSPSAVKYGFVQDGANHFNISSTFVTAEIAVDTAGSFLVNTVLSGSFQTNASASSFPIWMTNTASHKFINSYAASQTACVNLYGITGTNPNTDAHFELLCEAAPVLDVFRLDGTEAAPTFHNLYWKGPASAVSRSIFYREASVTGANCYNCTIDNFQFQGTTPALWGGQEAGWRASFVYVRLPSSSWVAPADFYASGQICLTEASTACQFKTAVYANRATAGQTSLFSIGRTEFQGVASDTSVVQSYVPSGGLGTSYLTVSPAHLWSWLGSASTPILTLSNAGALTATTSVTATTTLTANLATSGQASVISNGRLRVAGHAGEPAAVQEFRPNGVNSSFLFVDTAETWTIRNSLSADLAYITAAGNALHLGYMNVGSLSAPANTTAGDLTAIRGFYSGPVISQSLRASSTAPTPSVCGTSPAVTSGSSNNSGKVTLGTGTPTACTLTFANAYPTAAFCTVSAGDAPTAGSTIRPYVSAASTTAFTVTLNAALDSAVIYYYCSGN